MHDRWGYQRLIEGLPDSAVVVDAAGIIVAINRLAATRFGWDHDQIVGAAIWRQLDQDSWSILCTRWRAHGEVPQAPENPHDDAKPEAMQSLVGLSCAVSPLPVGGAEYRKFKGRYLAVCRVGCGRASARSCTDRTFARRISA